MSLNNHTRIITDDKDKEEEKPIKDNSPAANTQDGP